MSEEHDEYVVQGMIAECQAGPPVTPLLDSDQMGLLCRKCLTSPHDHSSRRVVDDA